MSAIDGYQQLDEFLRLLVTTRWLPLRKLSTGTCDYDGVYVCLCVGVVCVCVRVCECVRGGRDSWERGGAYMCVCTCVISVFICTSVSLGVFMSHAKSVCIAACLRDLTDVTRVTGRGVKY